MWACVHNMCFNTNFKIKKEKSCIGHWLGRFLALVKYWKTSFLNANDIDRCPTYNEILLNDSVNEL